MKRLAALILCSVCAIVVAAQKNVLAGIPDTGASPAAFIPKGYDTLETARGDLNKDGKADIVLALQSDAERDYSFETETAQNPDELPARILLVLLKQEKGYRLVAKTDEVLLCRHCGGIYGDPFAGISIEKGILVVEHYGGSAWRWGYTHKFRWQKNDMYLIGETSLSYWNVAQCDKLDEFAGTEFMDINYVTGQYEQKKVSAEGCKLLINKKGKKAVKPLKKLSQFSIEQ